jgi:hypothetical protein
MLRAVEFAFITCNAMRYRNVCDGHHRRTHASTEAQQRLQATFKGLGQLAAELHSNKVSSVKKLGSAFVRAHGTDIGQGWPRQQMRRYGSSLNCALRRRSERKGLRCKLQTTERYMTDPKAIHELRAQLNRDRKMLADLRRRETDLLQSMSAKGFHEGQERRHLLSEIEQLQDSINKNARMLEFAKK